MSELQEGCLLRIFIGESDKKDNMPLYEWLVQHAKKAKLLGATVLRGIEGFGSHSDIHTVKILQLSTNLPLIVEIIDTTEKIEEFLVIVDSAMNGGLVTLEKIKIKLYRSVGDIL
jgi:PII-like signaling protein